MEKSAELGNIRKSIIQKPNYHNGQAQQYEGQRRNSQDRARKFNKGELTNISCGRSESLLRSQGPLQRIRMGDDTQPYEGVGRYGQHSVRDSNKGVLTSGTRVRSERPIDLAFTENLNRRGYRTGSQHRNVSRTENNHKVARTANELP